MFLASGHSLVCRELGSRGFGYLLLLLLLSLLLVLLLLLLRLLLLKQLAGISFRVLRRGLGINRVKHGYLQWINSFYKN